MYEGKNKRKMLNQQNEIKGNKSVHNVSSWYGIIGIIFVITVGYISHHSLSNLPEPLLLHQSSEYSESFIGERSWNDLKKLTDIGPRVRGTYNNEVLAVKFFIETITEINDTKHMNQKIVLEHQTVSGSFSSGWKHQTVTNMYRNVQNIIVKLVGQNDDSLLLNCHFDSVSTSPGASDDGGSCAVLLEVLRVLSRRPRILTNSVVFLFNGAEETSLQGSHGFITQHMWAKQIRTFINLESAGSGGKEILFQSGPKNPWLIEMYAKAAVHPFAHAAGEELFQSEIIPSDTDFRIFRDFGRIPGLDFAHMMNGYRYHTKYDTIDYVPMNVLQRTGDNILSLTSMLANSGELKNIVHHVDGLTVFYDFIGMFIISYSADFGIILNLSIVLLSVTIPYLSLTRATRGTHADAIIAETILGLVASILSFVVSFSVCYFIATQFDAFGKSMTWYSSTNLIVGVYCCPALLTQCLMYCVYANLFSNRKSPLSLSLIVQSRLNGVNLLWGAITLVVTFAGYRIGYSFMILLFFTMLSSTVVLITKTTNSVKIWLYVHLFFQIFAILWTTQYYHILLSLFIPITGRSGGKKNVDISIGTLAAFCTFLAYSYMIPLIHLLKRKDKLFTSLSTIFLVSVLLAVFTHVGFPYRDDNGQDPTVQRHYITHTSRTFFDYNGNVRFTDSGYLIRKLDRNTEQTINTLVDPNKIIPQFEMKSCENEIYCALPLYSYFHQFNYLGYWVPASTPLIEKIVDIHLEENRKLSNFENRLQFTLKGSIQTSLMIRPKPNVTMVNWNLLDHIPFQIDLNKDRAFFVVITHGIKDESMDVILDLKHDHPNYIGPLVDLTVVTTHWEYQKHHTREFEAFLSSFPHWSHPIPSVANVNAYTF